MKQNFKKSITIILIYCMGIGCFTFFIGALYPISQSDGTAEAMNQEDELITTEDTDEISPNKEDAVPDNLSLASIRDVIPEHSTVPSAAPTPPPVYELTEGGHPEIEKFFHDFYVAWNSCDYSLIKSLTTDPENAVSLPDLQKETRFLDDIRDNAYYIMKSYEEDTYIVYAYYEIKYVNIKTPLPRLDKFYLIKDDEGNLKIFTSEMDEMLKAYYDERDQDEKVQEIIQMTNNKAKEALDNDVDLRVYVEALYNK